MKTQDLLDQIKPHARPTWSARLDEMAATATRNGWTAQDLASVANKGIGTNTGTGYVVVTLERLAQMNKRQDDTPTNTTGPCTTPECTNGWIDYADAVAPCPTCRPDTTRRLHLRTTAKTNGASLTAIHHAMTNQPNPTPHTYPTNTQ
jgi:hypothetical protein